MLYPSITDVLSCIWEQIDIHKRAHSDIIFEEDITSGKIFMNIDRTQFIQVINNLLWNAIKFTQKKDPHIWIQAYRDGSALFFAIEDYQMIFEKYHSGHKTLWLWIGLYLCKKIIDLHGGNIHATAWKKLWWMRVEIKIPIQENLTN
jgi:K+-sensing histidine kinase KdpD